MASSSRNQPLALKNPRQVSAWLFVLCFMLLGMIALGGATRLTGSGLSIMDWEPVRGIIPPLSHKEWLRLFELYKTIPQYKLLHEGFGLEGFQQIFWLEWIHRFWGRLMGLVLLVPLVIFAIKGALSRRLMLRLLLLFILGGLQGAIGWFMVASGFEPDSTAVSPFRLVLHLCFALALYAALFWTALSVRTPEPEPVTPTAGACWARRGLVALCGLVAVTIIAGGFTAGTHAGFVYNTFPLMDNHTIPPHYADMSPWWKNLFFNVAAVQFNHRLLATLTVMLVGITLLAGLGNTDSIRARNALMLVGWGVIIQYGLGVATVLLVVPVWAGTLHQTFAVIFLTTILLALHRFRGTGA